MIGFKVILGCILLTGTLGFMFAITFQTIKMYPYWALIPAMLLLISILLMLN